MRNAKIGGTLDRFAQCVKTVKERPVTRMDLVEIHGLKYDTAHAYIKIMLANGLAEPAGTRPLKHGGDDPRVYRWAR